MAIDPWLPRGLQLPGGARARRAILGGVDWQIWELEGHGRVLLATDPLSRHWMDSGLVQRASLAPLQVGNATYQTLTGGPNHHLVPVASGLSPMGKADALSFAVALRETRVRAPAPSLHDAIWCESLARL